MRDDKPERGGASTAALIVVPLIVAAMLTLGAPRTALAANKLSDGSVTPTTGTPATVFSFSVHYTSGQGPQFPATRVVARVAGGEVELALVSGSNVDGTYAGSSTLPAGTWNVVFFADASHGPDPTLPGPTLVVTGPPTPTPAPTAAPTPAATPTSPPPPAPAPTASVPGSSAPSSPKGTPPRPAPTPLPGVAAASQGAAAEAQGTDAPGGGAAPDANAATTGAAASSSADPAAAAVESPSGSIPASEAERQEQDSLGLWLLLGGGMAAIGLAVVLVQAFGLRERRRGRPR